MAADLTDGQVELRVDTDAALVIGPNTNYRPTADLFDLLGAPEVRSFDQARSGADGYIAGQDRLGKHTSNLVVNIIADTEAELGDRIDAWKAACAKSDDGLVTIRFSQFGRVRRRTGKFSLPGEIISNRTMIAGDAPVVAGSLYRVYVRGGAQFEALDPLTYGDEVNSGSTVRTQPGAGIAPPFTPPFTLPAEVVGSFTITNGGNASAPWTARLDGPLSFPEITHVESGKRLSLSFSANGGVDLASGEWIDLDSSLRSVLLNGTADRRTQLTLDSEWWDLDPGENTFQLAADSGAGTLTVNARDAFYS